MPTDASWVHSLSLLQYTVHQLQLGQTGLLQASIFRDHRLDLVSQRLNVLGVGRQVVHDVREEMGRSVNRSQGKAHLGPSDIHWPPGRNLFDPVQCVCMCPCGFLLGELAFADEFALFNLAVNNSGGDFDVFPGLAGGRQDPVDQRTKNRWPKSEVAGSKEGVDGVVDGDVQPLLVATDLLAQKDKSGQPGHDIGDLLGKSKGYPLCEHSLDGYSIMHETHVPLDSGSFSSRTAAVSLESGVVNWPRNSQYVNISAE